MSQEPFRHDTNLKIGENRGKSRIWLEGDYLTKAKFIAGARFSVSYDKGSITITLAHESDAKSRIIAGKTKGEKTTPIIDLENEMIAKTFPNAQRVAVHIEQYKIVLTPSRIAKKIAGRAMSLAAVGLFVGGGLLSEAAKAAGFETRVANEIHDGYSEVYSQNHPGYMMATSIEEAEFEHAAERYGPFGLLHAGIPCEPFTNIRRNTGNQKADSSLVPEVHELGDMTFWTLRAVDIFNPHTVVIEQVPAWLESGAGCIARHALNRMGYTVDSRVVTASDFGGYTRRKRAVMVATTFDSVRWPEMEINEHTMSDVLLPVDDPRCEWFTCNTPSKSWLFDHWSKQKAKGNGLFSSKILYSDKSVATIKKRYLAGQGDNPVVQNPLDKSMFRWLTLTELKRIMRLPDSYSLGETKTLAGEMIGQGVEVESFTRIIRSVTRQGCEEVLRMAEYASSGHLI